VTDSAAKGEAPPPQRTTLRQDELQLTLAALDGLAAQLHRRGDADKIGRAPLEIVRALGVIQSARRCIAAQPTTD
jgi:hypothetical protein